MRQQIRRILFALFLSVFLIGAPIIILYTAGYRLNTSSWKIQRTGVIAITTFPRNATVTVNASLVSEKTPFVDPRLMPGEYSVLLAKNGYRPWSQHVHVDSGKTTYLTAFLFRNSQPELLLEEHPRSVTSSRDGRFLYLLIPALENTPAQVWLYDTITRLQQKISDVDDDPAIISLSQDEQTILLAQADHVTSAGINRTTGAPLSADELHVATNLLPEFELHNNGTNIEFRKKDTQTLLALLPLGEYTPLLRQNDFALMKDNRDRTYFISIPTGSLTEIPLPHTLITPSHTDNALLLSDGNEVLTYTPQTGEKTLIARQSEPIIGTAWHTSDQVIFLSTASRIVAIEREKYENRQTTELVADVNIIHFWIDTTGRNLLFFGTVGDIQGIWNIALTN